MRVALLVTFGLKGFGNAGGAADGLMIRSSDGLPFLQPYHRQTTRGATVNPASYAFATATPVYYDLPAFGGVTWQAPVGRSASGDASADVGNDRFNSTGPFFALANG